MKSAEAEEVAHLLTQIMGLDAASVGPSLIERAVRQRQAACRLGDAHSYLRQLKGSSDERQALIEAVVVPETWFFRDRPTFAALGTLVTEGRIPVHADGVVRILSLPCSTGEEPYSIAMTLLDAGLAANRFKVEAVDISAQALERAVRGTYGGNSFRGSDLGYRDRHFVAAPQGFELRDLPRGQVSFRRGNLFDEILPAAADRYQVVFCRNVLIYFDRAGQDRAIGVLSLLLEEKGLLFVGSSETALLLDHGFASLELPLAFGFHQREAGRREASAGLPPTLKRPSAARSRAARGPRASPRPPLRSAPRPQLVDPPAETPKSLDQASLLADQGHLAEAARHCEAHLALHGPSARAYYLLGLVRDAGGHPAEAAELYRKALYLDPAHEESLAHLALLLDGLGDVRGARAAEGRAHRQARKAGA
jgi:chemotaxis protein methyltransferase WspC